MSALPPAAPSALDPAVALALRAALALLFGAAALHKLRDPGAFRASLAAYGVVPPALVGAGAVLVVAAELAAAVLLLGAAPAAGDPLAAAGPLLSAALLAVYGAAISWNLARGRRELDCGCLGPGSRQPLSGWLVARNVVLVAAALACLLPVSERSLLGPDAVSVVGATLFAAFGWIGAHQALANRLRRAAPSPA